MHTIVLEDFGYFLGKKGERLVVKKKGKVKAEFPVSDVERVIISSSGASVSSAALYLAVDNRVPVVFTYSSGHPFAFVMPTLGHGTVLTRRGQYLNAENETGLHLAKSFVEGKLLNQRILLKMWAKNRTRTDPDVSDFLFEASEHVYAAIDQVKAVSGKLSSITRLEIMNIEGRASSHYWSGIAQILTSNLGFSGRKTKGAKDPFNMILNYGYGILYSEVWSAVTKAGLDPYAGFLHVDRPGRPSLVLDVIEEFRQQIVDRTVVGMATKNMFNPDSLIEDSLLSKGTRTKIVEGVVSRLSDRVQFAGKQIPLSSVIMKQAWAVAKLVRGDASQYTPFSLRW
ncbi:MAG: CRISPR-associated endonuclease Cas1 [Candidatus Lokiarchaeota archaeon]|nr:CRISPR-associated endonuclease Cas1 [Candidatus Lokiarchaeota archaeon]